MVDQATPGLLDIPDVQEAISFALTKLASWQDVPGRVSTDLSAIQTLAAAARDAGDAGTLAELTALQQALKGVQQQYLDSASLLASVLRTAQAVQQTGQSPDAGAIADAGRLAAIIASGLGALQATEQELVQLGGDITVGEGGGLSLPPWAKAVGIGFGVWLFLKAIGAFQDSRERTR